MNSTERVLTVCNFQRPDRIPRVESFWDNPPMWSELLGPLEKLSDILIWVPDETTFPNRAQVLKEDADWIYEVDGWGRTIRSKKGAYYVETINVPFPEGTDPESVEFDPAHSDTRFLQGQTSLAQALGLLARDKSEQCVFGKTGGPYLRSTFVRGETQFLMDIAADPGLAKAFADKMGEHLLAIGIEEIHRWSLQETGIWIFDDMAHNLGPMFRPSSFEKIFLPAYRRMIQDYKAAGARYVFLHSDGDIRPVLDMLVDAGIDGINPMERRANMDPFCLRKKYPRLILTGGMDNTDTLIHGPIERIVKEAKDLIDLGAEGGLVIGTHSISPEISLENFLAYDRTCMTYGNFSS
jgi:uroporphyrinogen-III decarboxylase